MLFRSESGGLVGRDGLVGWLGCKVRLLLVVE